MKRDDVMFLLINWLIDSYRYHFLLSLFKIGKVKQNKTKNL